MSEQEELRRLVFQKGSSIKGFGEFAIVPGELTLWRWSTGEMVLTAIVNEPPPYNSINVMKINADGKLVGCSVGMVSWALERVKRHMILDALADV